MDNRLLKSSGFFLLLWIQTLTLSAQVDILQPPTPAEKKEIKKAIADYTNFLNSQVDTALVRERKNAQAKFLKDRLTSANVFAYNDIDSLPGANEFLPVFKYTDKLRDSARGRVSIRIDTAKMYVDKIKYDKIRRFYFADAKVIKEVVWKEIRRRPAPVDTVAVRDSLAADSAVVLYDTLVRRIQHKVTLYLKFDKENNLPKNFKFFAFTKTGVAPKFEPLPPLVTWWLQLDPEWKEYFRTKRKMEEYPREFDIEKLTGQFELDLSGAPVKTLEPLKNFFNLEKLVCPNTQVKSFEPLTGLRNLKVLNISKTKIDTLAGIEKLKSLEELYCAGNGLEGILEVKELKNLLRFDCSENMLTDIEPVKSLVFLRELNFSLNIKIKSIEPVRDLDSLRKLSMRKIDVRNLDAIKKLKHLVHLDLFNTNVTNLEALKGLYKLTYLDLSHNKMPNLTAISNHKYITELFLASSSINNLSDIRSFEYLRVLDVSNTELTDLGPVHRFEDIQVLKAYYTNIGKDEIQRFKKNHPKCQITYY